MPAAHPTGFLFESLEVAGREYRYSIYVPRDYTPDRAWPLVTFLNGYGECGTDGSRQLSVGLAPAIMANPSDWPMLALFPQKPHHNDLWEDHDDAVMAMVHKTQTEYNLDGSRLTLTGLSQGGRGTWAIGALHPDVWAALAPICGYGDPDAFAPPLAHTPIWCFHGDADTTVKLEQSQRLTQAVNDAGGDPKLTIYPGVGHNSWDKAYRDENLAAWLLSHSRSAS